MLQPTIPIFNHTLNPNANTSYYSSRGQLEYVDPQLFINALVDTHQVIDSIQRNVPVDIFGILGMRNLSAFIGELFARSFAKLSNGRYLNNPHQDGYPDLLLMDDFGKADLNNISLTANLRDKAPFSPFINGGLEVKATCGSVPSPKELQKKGLSKPAIGDQRIDLLRSYDWKAHHRQTNNLIGILWDFVNGTPYIVAIFLGLDLEEEDWGDIIHPKEDGGRTTSVSIMTKKGVGKMFDNLILVDKNEAYISRINDINKRHGTSAYQF